MAASSSITVTANPAGGAVSVRYRVVGLVNVDTLEIDLKKPGDPVISVETASPAPASGDAVIGAPVNSLAGSGLGCVFFISAPAPPAIADISVEVLQNGATLGTATDHSDAVDSDIRYLRIGFK